MANYMHSKVKDCRICELTSGKIFKQQKQLKLFPESGALEFSEMDVLLPLERLNRVVNTSSW